MESFLQSLVAPGDFLPHGLCLTWRPELIWTHLLSDILIGLAYFSIPVGLLYFVWQRQDLAYKWIFLMFCGFILACGVTHFFGAWTLWHPDYIAQGVVKAFTAAISVVTAVVLWPLIPQALALPSPAQLREANSSLEMQILERRRAEMEVRRMVDELEARVAERTAELQRANEFAGNARRRAHRRIAGSEPPPERQRKPLLQHLPPSGRGSVRHPRRRR